MTAFNVQALQGFDAPPPPAMRGLIGVGEQRDLRSAEHRPFQRTGISSTFAEELILHEQSRPTFEHSAPGSVALIGIGSVSHELAHAISALGPADETQNLPLALFRELLREAAKGIDAGQDRHLREIKAALDAERSPHNKLFR